MAESDKSDKSDKSGKSDSPMVQKLRRERELHDEAVRRRLGDRVPPKSVQNNPSNPAEGNRG